MIVCYSTTPTFYRVHGDDDLKVAASAPVRGTITELFSSPCPNRGTITERCVCYSGVILFTVRIWLDSAGKPQLAWRGKVQHPASGAWRHFQDWAVLTTFLQTQLEELAPKTEPR